MYDCLIVGAGLYGAVAARELTDAGLHCLVIDRRCHIAGNAYTETVSGIPVHRYGPHIFHTSDRQVWDYANRFAHFNHFINSPLAVYGEEVYNLPFNMNTFSRMWGIRTPAQAKAIIQAQAAREKIGEPANLEQQALKLVGRDVYRKLIRGYTEKQWGKPCRELPPSILRRLPCRFTYDNNYFSDPFQGIPEDGYTRMVEQLLAGIRVLLNTEYSALHQKHPGIANVTVYTGCIDEYYGYRFGPLQYRALRFETEELPTKNYQGNAVVNYTAREIPYTRIIEHKHFTFGTQPTTVITREYPAAWQLGEEPFYPVNDEANTALYQKYRTLADRERGIFFGGRLGTYRYLDMDKVIRAALDDVPAIEKFARNVR